MVSGEVTVAIISMRQVYLSGIHSPGLQYKTRFLCIFTENSLVNFLSLLGSYYSYFRMLTIMNIILSLPKFRSNITSFITLTSYFCFFHFSSLLVTSFITLPAYFYFFHFSLSFEVISPIFSCEKSSIFFGDELGFNC